MRTSLILVLLLSVFACNYQALAEKNNDQLSQEPAQPADGGSSSTYTDYSDPSNPRKVYHYHKSVVDKNGFRHDIHESRVSSSSFASSRSGTDSDGNSYNWASRSTGGGDGQEVAPTVLLMPQMPWLQPLWTPFGPFHTQIPFESSYPTAYASPGNQVSQQEQQQQQQASASQEPRISAKSNKKWPNILRRSLS